MLEAKTIRVSVDGVERYATPLLRKKDFPQLHVSPEVVKGLLRSTERKLVKHPDLALIYNQEIKRLVDSGYVVKLSTEELNTSTESWYHTTLCTTTIKLGWSLTAHLSSRVLSLTTTFCQDPHLGQLYWEYSSASDSIRWL